MPPIPPAWIVRHRSDALDAKHARELYAGRIADPSEPLRAVEAECPHLNEDLSFFWFWGGQIL